MSYDVTASVSLATPSAEAASALAFTAAAGVTLASPAVAAAARIAAAAQASCSLAAPAVAAAAALTPAPPRYHVFWNAGTGGPVDLSVAYATVLPAGGPGAPVAFTPAALEPSKDYTFLVRAFDPATGFVEKNVTATFRVVTDADGADVTNVPRAPQGLTARASGAGSAVLSWFVLPPGPTAAAAGFRVYAGPPGSVDLSAPVMTLAADGRSMYRLRVSGLTPGALAFVLRAFNATGEDANTREARVAVAAPGGPLAPLTGGLVATTGVGRPPGARPRAPLQP